MTNTERVVVALLVLFMLIALIVFRRRWQGALGWTMMAGAFGYSLLQIREGGLIDSVIVAIVVVAGIGLAGYDYLRYERPKRRLRRQQLDPTALPDVRVKRRFQLYRRRRPPQPKDQG